MSNPFKAIDTYYNGIKFRSRLEARFAVFFDACGLNWEYEKEGYELINPDDNEKKFRYLPDFIIHNVSINGSDKKGKIYDLYVEVKGDIFPEEDKLKHWWFSGARSGHVDENGELVSDDPIDEDGILPRPLLVVGPYFPKRWKKMLDSFYENERYYSFENIDDTECPAQLLWKNGRLFVWKLPMDSAECRKMLQDTGLTLEDIPDLDIPIQKALSARFEFGETPDIKMKGE